MKQEERREYSKRQLLEATEALIKEKGCSKTTIQDIMKRTGMSKGAIFHYVSSKDELYVLVMEAKLAQKHELFMAEVSKQKHTDKHFDGPMNVVAGALPSLENQVDVSNLILMYLIGRSDQPEIARLLPVITGKLQPPLRNGLWRVRMPASSRHRSMQTVPLRCWNCYRWAYEYEALLASTAQVLIHKRMLASLLIFYSRNAIRKEVNRNDIMVVLTYNRERNIPRQYYHCSVLESTRRYERQCRSHSSRG
ncbi:TetR/AcrR family transcriptional regulator [Paenibacillus sp. JCM 10914]|uniref:TetR/AcrR family transcriptional regulator n=1 Tax=Paenibacillus sp. JCM 10914 TaxID=1236974 RepID=UPI0003CC7932|nr:helix-turn-helix domain-containing protein [Paenibacillus sp. JCM 10914]GAE05514.1 transcriptional regulator [Paenibacillus sp. JCM 10914]